TTAIAIHRASRLVGRSSVSSAMGAYSTTNLHQPPPTTTVLSIIRNAAAALRASTPVRSARRRAPPVPALARPRGIHGPCRLVTRAVRDRHAPAQHHGDPPHGPAPQQ